MKDRHKIEALLAVNNTSLEKLSTQLDAYLRSLQEIRATFKRVGLLDEEFQLGKACRIVAELSDNLGNTEES